MSDPNVIEHEEKIGIGTFPIFGVFNMIADVSLLSADWFYTWTPEAQSSAVTGWLVGSGATLAISGSDTTLSLQGADGWAYQNFQVTAGQNWSLGFEAGVSKGGGGVVVTFSDDRGAAVASNWVPLTNDTQSYALTGQVPQGAIAARITAYADAASTIQADDFHFDVGHGNTIYNGGFESLLATTPASGFVPMIWSGADIGKLDILAAANPGGPLLTFNEPDEPTQSNMSVDEALALWPQLMASGMRLGSPAVTTPDAMEAGGWLDSFMSRAQSLGYRVDFVAVHYYTNNPDVTDFKDFLDAVHAKYGKPIWVTEWSLADWSNPGRFTAAEQEAFFTAGSHLIDDLDYVERQSWFSSYSNLDGWSLNSGLFDAGDVLTSLGNTFLSLAAEPIVPRQSLNVIMGDPSTRTYVGTAGQDMVDFSHLKSAISANLGNLKTYVDIEDLAGGSGDDCLYGNSSANHIFGGAGNDRLKGAAGDDELFGGDGADRLFGDAGQDRMIGGAGDDTYYVDDLGDVVDETNQSGGDAGGNDLVRSGVSFQLQGLAQYVERLTLTGASDLDGSGNDLANTLLGNSGRNILDGENGNDTIKGYDGSDTLIGGSGNDRLWGGAGSDVFFFDHAFGKDRVEDFQALGLEHDVLNFSVGSAFDTFEEVMAASRQKGGNTIIDLGGEGSVTLVNVSLGMLSAEHFSFG